MQTPDVLNGIHRLTRYSQLGNLWSVPTDCPQRERRGWMGDAQVECGAEAVDCFACIYDGRLQAVLMSSVLMTQSRAASSADRPCLSVLTLSQVSSNQAMLKFDMHRFYVMFLANIRDSQVGH